MNVTNVVGELRNRYPQKAIFKNDESNPTEIVCEIEPSVLHPEYSEAVAIIDRTDVHKHLKSTETYKVMRGVLTLNVDGQEHTLNEGDEFTVKPQEVHSAIGDETWVYVTSRPGWTFSDHIMVNNKS